MQTGWADARGTVLHNKYLELTKAQKFLPLIVLLHASSVLPPAEYKVTVLVDFWDMIEDNSDLLSFWAKDNLWLNMKNMNFIPKKLKCKSRLSKCQ